MKKNLWVIFFYLIAVLAIYPIVRYLLVFKFDLFSNNIADKFVMSRIFLSGPILLIMGFVLFFKNKKIQNRIFGIFFSMIGVIWIIAVILTIIKEAA